MDAQDGQDCEGTLAERAKDAEIGLFKIKTLAILASWREEVQKTVLKQSRRKAAPTKKCRCGFCVSCDVFGFLIN